MWFNKTNLTMSLGLSLLQLVTLNTTYAQTQCPSGNMAVSFDLSKTNNASIKNDNTYIVVLGIDPATGKHAFVEFDENNNRLVDVTSADMNGKDYGIPLSSLKQNSDGLAQTCIPHITSGRIYLSFGNALDMPTDSKTLTPIQPNVNDPGTTTNGTLFDKVEFNYSTSGETVINPTGVDFLAIPYTIKQAGLEYGHAGSLDGVIQNMKYISCHAANLAPHTSDCDALWQQSEWSSLIIYNEQNTLMRVEAPGRDGDRFSSYFNNYINALSDYYSADKNKEIKINLKELNQGMWSGSFKPNSKTIIFHQIEGRNPTTYSYDFGYAKTSNSIFMGAQTPFDNRDAIDSTLARDLTSAIVSGMLMRKPTAFIGKDFFDHTDAPVFKNKEQMTHLMEYYFNNIADSVDYVTNQCGKNNDQPCINVYSEAMHALIFDKNIEHPQPNFLTSYAFAYDDFLGMDGTNTQTDQQPATIVLGDMEDRKIPHIDY